MTKRRPNPVADAQEVLAAFSSIMRGDMTEEATRKVGGTEERIQVPAKISDRHKAAEVLARHYGLLDRKEEAQPPGEIAARVTRLLEEMHGAAEGSD